MDLMNSDSYVEISIDFEMQNEKRCSILCSLDINNVGI
jgi:hypothetical protein